jgi:hypothetical protein
MGTCGGGSFTYAGYDGLDLALLLLLVVLLCGKLFINLMSSLTEFELFGYRYLLFSIDRI